MSSKPGWSFYKMTWEDMWVEWERRKRRQPLTPACVWKVVIASPSHLDRLNDAAGWDASSLEGGGDEEMALAEDVLEDDRGQGVAVKEDFAVLYLQGRLLPISAASSRSTERCHGEGVGPHPGIRPRLL